MPEESPQLASSLLEAHDKLEAAFALHQEALMLLDLQSATTMLNAYRTLLAVHMRHEEEVVLTLFRRAGAIKKWPEVLYTGQHTKMNEHLSRIDTALKQLTSLDGRVLRREIQALLDLEATYKHLVEHHDGAEREGLFPTVDAVLTEEESRVLIPRLLAEWRGAVDQTRPSYERIAASLDLRAQRLSPAG